MDPYRAKIQNQLTIFEMYDVNSRLDLLRLAKKIIEQRIQNGKMETRLVVDKDIDYIIDTLFGKRGRLSRGTIFDYPELLEERFGMVWSTIKKMDQNQLCSLVSKLRSDKPLADILGNLKASKYYEKPSVIPRIALKKLQKEIEPDQECTP